MNAIVQPRERPILMSAPMVLALLAGTKSQTRRVVTNANSLVNGDSFPKRMWPGLDFARAWVDGGPSPAGNAGPYLKAPFALEPDWPARAGFEYRVYTRMQVGDRLWVRETFALSIHDPDTVEPCTRNPGDWDPPVYRADSSGGDWRDSDGKQTGAPWRPSIFMPRWASRITLEIADVRVQRLAEISDADALAEGVDPSEWTGGPANEAPRAAFRELWERINGARPGCAWADDPWTWAISFRRICG